ncbi:nuclear transport factor 2 family protein [Massilia endophytica]|uniref:nuclear transport factor 2 family protein n=1 Tax=Massilia endophytica TaxID=2899220 RepID=UPI001E461A03|nr:nuclear transport factor 2 family protein [Massilia endophytica]UGQ48245.1 nuclear transport factor 2 family protein [Massilia endophytica]
MKFLAGFILACTMQLATAADTPVQEIEKIVHQFQRNIIEKDAAALGALFLEKDNSWLTVLSDESYETMKAKHGSNMPRVRSSNYASFVKFVGESKRPVEEKFYNVQIHTNGYVATVYFDFDFLDSGNVVNKGAESWHLVRTNEGWKISSMVYSIGR